MEPQAIAGSTEVADAVEALKQCFDASDSVVTSAARRAEDALSRWSGADSKAAEGWLWLARHSYLDCRPDDLTRAAMRAASLARDCGDAGILRAAIMLEGMGRLERHEFGEATRLLAEALQIAQQLGDTDAEASVLNNIGLTALVCGEYSRALATFRLASSKSQTVRPAAVANIALCAVHCRAPELLDGIDLESLHFPNSRGGQLHRAALYANLCRLALQSLDFDRARLCAAACEAAASVGDPRTVRTARLAPLLVDIANGGMAGLQGVKDILEESDAGEKGMWLVALSEAHELAGQHDEALRALREVIRQARMKQQLILQAPEIVETHRKLDERLKAKADQLENEVAGMMSRLTDAAIHAQLASGHDVYRVYRTEKLATLFAQHVGLTEAEVESIGVAGRLYDVGMLALPKHLLQKQTLLRETERILLERHTGDGADMLRRSGLASLFVAARVASEHHERWDGSGYPAGMRGSEISLPARVVSLCDAFDAIVHKRPYRRALSISFALRELTRASGSQFDPVLCKQFVGFIQELFWQQDDLEEYLRLEGRNNAFVLARERIDALLGKGRDG